MYLQDLILEMILARTARLLFAFAAACVLFLGALPLDKKIREEVDSGRPTVAVDPEDRTSQIYREIARRTAAKLSLRAKEYSAKFPNIVIQNN